MAKKKRESAAVWRQRVQAWHRSGLSCRAFADRAGIHPRSLTWWAWKLRQDGAAAEKTKRPAFVPVEVVHSPAAAPTERLEVVLPGGARLHVPAQFDPTALAQVIAVLEGAR
jgi:hypothetical protein